MDDILISNFIFFKLLVQEYDLVMFLIVSISLHAVSRLQSLLTLT